MFSSRSLRILHHPLNCAHRCRSLEPFIVFGDSFAQLTDSFFDSLNGEENLVDIEWNLHFELDILGGAEQVYIRLKRKSSGKNGPKRFFEETLESCET